MMMHNHFLTVFQLRNEMQNGIILTVLFCIEEVGSMLLTQALQQLAEWILITLNTALLLLTHKKTEAVLVEAPQ